MADEQTPAQRNRAVLQAAGASINGPRETANFNISRYPQDVGSESHPHYVMFFITTRKSDMSGAEVAAPESLQFDYSQNNTTNKSAAAAATFAGLQGTTGVAQVGKAVGESNIVQSNAPNQQFAVVAGTAVGAAVGAVAGTALAVGLGNREQVLLKDAIALYMTGTPGAQYTAQWADQDLGLVAGVSQQLGASTDIPSAMMNILRSGTGAAASAILQQDTKFDTVGDIGGAFSSSAGVVANPFKAQLFKSMGFRQFSYEYTFLPKGPTEYEDIKKIIKTFKKYMHPKLGKEKFIMSYPAEFTIAYYHREKPNEELYRISNCALVSLNVEFGGGGDFTTFKPRTGSTLAGVPTEINLKMQFTELEILSRERIEDENF